MVDFRMTDMTKKREILTRILHVPCRRRYKETQESFLEPGGYFMSRIRLMPRFQFVHLIQIDVAQELRIRFKECLAADVSGAWFTEYCEGRSVQAVRPLKKECLWGCRHLQVSVRLEELPQLGDAHVDCAYRLGSLLCVPLGVCVEARLIGFVVNDERRQPASTHRADLLEGLQPTGE